MILGIHTCLNAVEVCVVDGKSIIESVNLPSDKQHAEQLMKTLETILPRFRDTIDEIMVVKGPGAFTSIRIGVASANALAYALSIPLKGISLFSLYKHEHPSLPVYFSAGESDLFLLKENDTHELVDLSFLKNEVAPFTGHLNESHHDALNDKSRFTAPKMSFAEALIATNLTAIPPVKSVEPYYLKEARITLSQKQP